MELPDDHRCAWRDEAEAQRDKVKDLTGQVDDLTGKLAAVMTAMEALERRVIGPKSEKMPPPWFAAELPAIKLL